MKKCPRCHKLNHNKAKFCSKCGYHFPVKQSTKQTTDQPQTIRCPKCGHANPQHARFCRYCGHLLSQRKQTPQQPINNEPKQRPQSSAPLNFTPEHSQTNQIQHLPNFRPWQHANPHNQSINQFSNYFMNYLMWLKKTLLHPLSINTKNNPYFGITSLAITTVILWITAIFSRSNKQIFSQVSKIFGYIPINSFYQATANASFKEPTWLLILTLLTIGTYWITGYVGSKILSHHPQNLFTNVNQFASVTNITIITAFLTFCGAILDKSVLVWFFITATKLIFETGLFYTIISISTRRKTNSQHNQLYVAMLTCFVGYLVQGLIIIVIGNLI